MRLPSYLSPERLVLLRLPALGGLELLHATYGRRTFPRHAHDFFAVGVVEAGALGFYYRGENVVAWPGQINLANPGEVHTGHGADERGWTYRMFYFDAELLRQAAIETSGKSASLPAFAKGVLEDPPLAAALAGLHRDLMAGDVLRLEQESRFLALRARLIRRHAEVPAPLATPLRHRRAVARAREYLHDRLAEDVSLAELAVVAGTSPFHLLRLFAEEMGLPPHAYLVQCRVLAARRLLARGATPATAAQETGFYDQSHLHRHFTRLLGVTPGRYRKIVQESRRRPR